MAGAGSGFTSTSRAKARAKDARGIAAQRTAQQPAFDPGAWAMGEMMKMYQDNGTYVPGTAPRLVSRSGERAAAQANYARAEKDRAKVYGEAVSEVKGRNPGIVSGYQKATDELQANVAARKLADGQAAQARDQRALAAAAAMGLSTAPPTSTRSDEILAENQGQYQTNADAWAGFNTGAGQRGVERNNAVADAFTWQGAQQQAALQQLLSQTLSGLVDYYTGGSAGRMVGGTTNSQKNSLLGKIMGYGDKDFKNDLAMAKFTTPTQSFSVNPKGGITQTTSGRLGYI